MMISTAMKFKLFTLANKYGVEVVHFTPGNVVLHIASWYQHEAKFIHFVDDLNNDPAIHNILLDKGIVDIHYEHNALDDPAVIQRWLVIFEKYAF